MTEINPISTGNLFPIRQNLEWPIFLAGTVHVKRHGLEVFIVARGGGVGWRGRESNVERFGHRPVKIITKNVASSPNEKSDAHPGQNHFLALHCGAFYLLRQRHGVTATLDGSIKGDEPN